MRLPPNSARSPTNMATGCWSGRSSCRLIELMTYYGDGRPGVHLPFNFQLVEAPWDAAALERIDRRL